MPLPDPRPGLVIGYSYLWKRESLRGITEGRKERPCIIVGARTDEDGDRIVYVVPVTHQASVDAIVFPASVKRRLGMDDNPSWILTSEVNRFAWPGPDLRPISRDIPDTFAWGFVSVSLFDAIRRGLQSARATRGLSTVQRES